MGERYDQNDETPIFYAAFVLCAVLVFAVDDESEIEKEKRCNRP